MLSYTEKEYEISNCDLTIATITPTSIEILVEYEVFMVPACHDLSTY